MAEKKFLSSVVINGSISMTGTVGASNFSGTHSGNSSNTNTGDNPGNTIIGTDSDINTSGAQVIDLLTMTDGVITAHSIRTMTTGDIGAQPTGDYLVANIADIKS